MSPPLKPLVDAHGVEVPRSREDSPSIADAALHDEDDTEMLLSVVTHRVGHSKKKKKPVTSPSATTTAAVAGESQSASASKSLLMRRLAHAESSSKHSPATEPLQGRATSPRSSSPPLTERAMEQEPTQHAVFAIPHSDVSWSSTDPVARETHNPMADTTLLSTSLRSDAGPDALPCDVTVGDNTDAGSHMSTPPRRGSSVSEGESLEDVVLRARTYTAGLGVQVLSWLRARSSNTQSLQALCASLEALQHQYTVCSLLRLHIACCL